MANPNPPISVSIDTISGYASALVEIAKDLQHLADRMKSQGIDEISTINFPSGQVGLSKIQTFATAAKTAFFMEIAKDPDWLLVKEQQKHYTKDQAAANKTIAKAEKKLAKKRAPK